MYSVQMDISPEIATEMLKHNTRNYRKKIREEIVSRYADDMKTGRWVENGETIVFHKDGSLADGQHRLHAIVRSGQTITMLVVYDVPDDITEFDLGLNRNEMDFAYANGIESIGTIGLGIISKLIAPNKKAYAYALSKTKKIEFGIKNKDKIRKVSRMIENGATRSISKKSAIGAVAYILLENGFDEEKLKRFFLVVNTGEYEGPEETAGLVLRNWLLFTYPKLMKTTKANSEMQEICYLSIKDFVNGKPRKMMYGMYNNEFASLRSAWLQLQEEACA